MERYEKASKWVQEIEDEYKERKTKKNMLNGFLWKLGNSGTAVEEFSEPMWTDFVERVVVRQDGTTKFSFRNGSMVEVK